MKSSKIDIFKDLTWGDIQSWAGATIVSRGQSYQRKHRVKELARTPGGGVIAWVYGTQRYATLVDTEEEELNSSCTCPYGDTCKHAVAVVLEYLEHLKQNIEVPVVTEQDQRLALLQEDLEGQEWGESDNKRGEDNSDSIRSSESPAINKLRSYLEGQTREQLIVLLEELAERHAVVRQSIEDRHDLSAGKVARLVDSVRKEIDALSAEPGWSNSWNNEGHIPDYSRVRERLKALIAKGHANEVVALGEKLLEAGKRQVEMTDDEGETAGEISSCLDVVFQALSQSSLSPAEQMLWAIDAELNDEYELSNGSEVFWEKEYPSAAWDTVAEKLMQRLNQQKPAKGQDSYSRSYRRERLSDWLILALEKAGRQDEIIPICEQEAKETASYVRLVNRLMKANRRKEAEHWIYEGIRATRKQWPGIASELQSILRQIREKDKDWPQVAALRAEDFFFQPSLQTFSELKKASEQAEAWPEVRAIAMHYLETGEIFRFTKKTTASVTMLPWPLPQTGLEKTIEVHHRDFPMSGTLIDIAIAEKNPGEVLHWYDLGKPESPFGMWTWYQEDKIAQAIADTYPDRAVGIWKKLAEAQIAQTQPKAYEVAMGFLRKLRSTLKKLGREGEWQSYLSQLRQANIRKKRLMELLDSLADGRIIKAK